MSVSAKGTTASSITKLVQELLASIQQTREAQIAAQELAQQVRSNGLPDLEQPEHAQQGAKVYQGYEIQAQIQQLRATRQDALDIMHEIAGLLLFIKSKIIAVHHAERVETAEILADCEADVALLKSRYAQVRKSKQTLLLNLRHQYTVLRSTQARMQCKSLSN